MLDEGWEQIHGHPSVHDHRLTVKRFDMHESILDSEDLSSTYVTPAADSA